jgi:hypothetical protein
MKLMPVWVWLVLRGVAAEAQQLSYRFRRGFDDGSANAFMTSYNAWNDIPMMVQPVLRDVVMKDWGFNGIVCTNARYVLNAAPCRSVF